MLDPVDALKFLMVSDRMASGLQVSPVMDVVCSEIFSNIMLPPGKGYICGLIKIPLFENSFYWGHLKKRDCDSLKRRLTNAPARVQIKLFRHFVV